MMNSNAQSAPPSGASSAAAAPLLAFVGGGNMASAILGGWLFGVFPFGRLLGSILTAFVGSVILLWLVRLAKKA